MLFVQLKPAERSFIDMARDLLHFDAIVLCEGLSDAELLKMVAGGPEANLAITDCGGVRGIYEIGRYVVALARLSRRLKALGVLVNADELRRLAHARCEEPKVSVKDVLAALGFEPLKRLRELLAEKPRLVHDAFWALRKLIALLEAS